MCAIIDANVRCTRSLETNNRKPGEFFFNWLNSDKRTVKLVVLAVSSFSELEQVSGTLIRVAWRPHCCLGAGHRGFNDDRSGRIATKELARSADSANPTMSMYLHLAKVSGARVALLLTTKTPAGRLWLIGRYCRWCSRVKFTPHWSSMTHVTSAHKAAYSDVPNLCGT